MYQKHSSPSPSPESLDPKWINKKAILQASEWATLLVQLIWTKQEEKRSWTKWESQIERNYLSKAVKVARLFSCCEYSMIERIQILHLMAYSLVTEFKTTPHIIINGGTVLRFVLFQTLYSTLICNNIMVFFWTEILLLHSRK